MTQCARKTAYTSRKEAENIRKAQEHRLGEPLRIYRCPPCKAWHLTHQPYDPPRRRGPNE